MRYFDTAIHTETHIKSATTIPYNDSRVVDFFKPLEDGYRIIFVNNLPIIEPIPLPTAEEIVLRDTTEANQLIYDELVELDMASIRDIREWISLQPSAPQSLKDREAQAVDARARIK